MTDARGESLSGRSLRARASLSLIVLTCAATVLGGPVVYSSYVVRNENRFVELADQVIDEPTVRAALADEIVEIAFTAVAADELVVDLLPVEARQLATPVTRLATVQFTKAAFDALDTDVAIPARSAALRELHRQIVDPGAATVTIDLRAVIVRVAREFGGPSVGSAVAAVASTQRIGRITIAREGSGSAAVVSLVRRLPDIGAVAVAVTAALFLLSVAVSTDWRRALMRAGLAIAAGAVLSAVVVSALLSAALNFGNDGALGDLGPAVATALSSDFAARQRGPMVTGLAIALVGLMTGRSPPARALRRLPRQLWDRDASATTTSVVTVLGSNPAFARLLVWVFGSVVLLSWPTPTLRVLVSIPLATIVGQLVIWFVTSPRPRAARWRGAEVAVVAVVVESADPVDDAWGRLTTRTGTNIAVVALVAFLVWPGWSRDLVLAFVVVAGLALAVTEIPGALRFMRRHRVGTPEPSTSHHGGRRRFVVAVMTVGAVMLGGVAVSAASGAGNGRAVSTGCNGHVELCGRRIDQITFAGSHNSMSSRDLGWDLAMQQGDIISQLDSGVRALLIDTHYWDRRGTVEGGDDPAAQFVIEDALANDRPQPGVWLCHGFCALGASRLDAVLAEIDTWLDENPREVLIMIIQDEISTSTPWRRSNNRVSSIGSTITSPERRGPPSVS